MLAISHETVHISNDILQMTYSIDFKKKLDIAICIFHMKHFVFVKTMLKLDQGLQPIEDKKTDTRQYYLVSKMQFLN